MDENFNQTKIKSLMKLEKKLQKIIQKKITQMN